MANSLNTWGMRLAYPLQSYHQKIAEAATFQPLQKNAKVKDLILRITAIAVAIFAYPILGAAALVGKMIDLLSNKTPINPNQNHADFTGKEIEEFERKYSGAKLINGTKIPGSVQEKNLGGYDWKQRFGAFYKDPILNDDMQAELKFLNQANSSVIAYKGVFSNFDQGFIYKNQNGSSFLAKSTEALFQAFKFPPKTSGRVAILNAPNAQEAKKITWKSTHFLKDKDVSNAWDQCKFPIMIYLQLKKAASNQMFFSALMDSKNAFIIEDGSNQDSKNEWADLSKNRLGFAQMGARELIREGVNRGQIKDSEDLEKLATAYYQKSVKQELDAYYNLGRQKGCF